MKKYIDIERLGHEDNEDIFLHDEDIIVIEEKVDGGNGSFWQEDDGIHFGSRNRDLTTDNDKKTFGLSQQQLKEHLGKLHREGVIINLDYIYYFEWMVTHTIRYTQAPFIIGFDIRARRSMKEGKEGLFLSREFKEKEFERLKLECVPLIWKGKAKDLKKMELVSLLPKSKYYDGLAEGICIKNYGRLNKRGDCQIFAKLVRDEFKEQNKIIFGAVKHQNSDTQKIVEEFATDARIKKTILKFVNEHNEKLDRKLMAKVPTEIIKDILKEEFKSIYENYSFIDFKQMRQIVPKKCLRVIDEMMMANVK